MVIILGLILVMPIPRKLSLTDSVASFLNGVHINILRNLKLVCPRKQF